MAQRAAERPSPVVVGVHGSACSRAALQWGLTQAELTGSTVEAVAALAGAGAAGHDVGGEVLGASGRDALSSDTAITSAWSP